MTKENAVREMLAAAETLIARGEKVKAFELLDKIIRLDFNNGTAWKKIYKLYNGPLSFENFRREFAQKRYPRHVHLLTENPTPTQPASSPQATPPKNVPPVTPSKPESPQGKTPGPISTTNPPPEPIPASVPAQSQPVMQPHGPEVAQPSIIQTKQIPVIQCPVCNRSNPPDAQLCAYCGCQFYPQTANKPDAAVAPAQEESRMHSLRPHFIDLGNLVIAVSLFLPWASIYQNTFLGNNTTNYDALSIITQFNGKAGVNISVILFLLLGMGAPILVRARLKALAILAAIGAIAAQVYTMGAINSVSGPPAGNTGMFFDLTSVSTREGVMVGLVGAVLVLIGVIYYETNFFKATANFLKKYGIILLIIGVLLGCFIASLIIYSNIRNDRALKESYQRATANAQSTADVQSTRASVQSTQSLANQQKTAVAVTQTAAVMQGDPWRHRVAFIAGGGLPGDVLTISTLDGFNSQYNTANGFGISLVRWSPDGKRLAYTAGTMDRSTHLYVCDADGTNAREIAYLLKINFTWSADSKSVLYVDSSGGEDIIRQVRLDNGENTKLFSNRKYFLSHIAAAPDGNRIAFSARCEKGTRNCIHIINLSNGEIQEVVFSNHAENISVINNISWSPDNRQLVFQSGDYEDGNIYRVNQDGSDLTRLSENGGFAPSWCLDGKWITYVSTTNPEQVIAMSSDGSQQIKSQIIKPIYQSAACGLP